MDQRLTAEIKKKKNETGRRWREAGRRSLANLRYNRSHINIGEIVGNGGKEMKIFS
jgi:hypothetical protein